jgi:hypothetical protein
VRYSEGVLRTFVCCFCWIVGLQWRTGLFRIVRCITIQGTKVTLPPDAYFLFYVFARTSLGISVVDMPTLDNPNCPSEIGHRSFSRKDITLLQGRHAHVDMRRACGVHAHALALLVFAIRRWLQIPAFCLGLQLNIFSTDYRRALHCSHFTRLLTVYEQNVGTQR